jgi:hypothetical protein
MSNFLVKEIRVNGAVTEIFEIESHLASNRCSNLYRGIYSEDSSVVSLWELRARVEGKAKEDFLSRLKKIAALKLPNCPLRAYGVDAEGRAFAIMEEIEASFVVTSASSKVDLREAERRFAPCLQTIAKLHQAGLIVGDIDSHTFVLDRAGKLLFIGVMGDSPLDQYKDSLLAEVDAISPDTFQFFAPEQRSGQQANMATDVFALGVLAYRLFGGRYPFGKISEDQYFGDFVYPDQVAEIVADRLQGTESLPSWCNDVFRRALHPNSLVRFQSATEMFAEIGALRQKAIDQAELPAQQRSAIARSAKYAQQIGGTQTFNSLRPEEEGDLVKNRFQSLKFTLLIGGTVALILGLSAGVWFFSGPSPVVPSTTTALMPIELAATNTNTKSRSRLSLLAEAAIDPAVKDAILKLIDVDDIVQANSFADILLASQDPLAIKALIVISTEHETPEIRKLCSDRILATMSQAGSVRSAELIREWLAQPRDAALIENIFDCVNRNKKITEREKLFRQVYPSDAAFVVNLAVASALDSGNISSFQPLLSQLIGDALGEKETRKYSAAALILADPQASEIFAEDVLANPDIFRKEDFIWLLQKLAKREDSIISRVAAISIAKLDFDGWGKNFLQILSEREDLPANVVLALINSTVGRVSGDDISSLGSWVDNMSQVALISIIATVNSQAGASEKEIVEKAFDTLAAKPLSEDALNKLVQIIRNVYYDQRAKLAKLVAVQTGSAEVNATINPEAISMLAEFIKDKALLRALLQTKNTEFIKEVLKTYSAELDLIILLDFLEHDSRDVRINTIYALKPYNDAISLKFVLERFKKEKDPEIIELYKQNFWMIAERYK